MKQALILTLTFLFLLPPPGSQAFNNTLAAPGASLSVASLSSVVLPVDRPLPFASKVIKELINANNPYQIKTVVIDAGHGGHDPGCSGSSSREKHLALAIAKRLNYLLEKNHPDLKVIMTRDRDVFIPLYKRAAIANRNQADLFISIHCNFMPGSSATRGTETYVMGLHTAEHNLKVAKRENASILLEEDYEKNYDYDPNSPEGHIMLSMYQSAYLEQSILFAELAEGSMKDLAGRRSRGVKQAGFVVLKETTMPSVLVETGFLSNKNEEAFLKTEGGQMKIAQALFRAFEAYKSTVESPEYLQFTEPFQEVASLPKAQKTEKVLRPADQNPATRPPAKKTVQRSAVPPPSPQKAVYSNVYQPPASKEPENTTTPLRFFVQLAASRKLQDSQDPRWNNLAYPVEVIQEGGLYKYRARNFADLPSARAAQKALREKGFPDAFIVVYQGEQKISMAEAQALLGK